ncbi:MAG: MarR family transcriptional regulator [Hyphomicrobiaceae bacterium]|nr:MarR family transcriptional regulator [Hyphomicrobiaceae bacterium]
MASTKDAPAMSLEHSPIHLLHRAGQCAGDIFLAEMGGEDLTPRQYAVLVAIAHNEGLSQTNLVTMTGIDRSTLADIIRRMLKKGLVQRRRTKEDARAYAVKLSDQGRRVLKAAEPLARRVDQRILDALPASERDRFVADLVKIVDVLGRLDAAMAATVKADLRPKPLRRK